LRFSTEARIWYHGVEGEADLRDPDTLQLMLSRDFAHLQRQYDDLTTMVVTKYTKVRELGSGSYARVLIYRGEHNSRQYAVKIFDKHRLSRKRFGMTSTALDGCVREVQLHKQLSHPNIVKIHKVVDDTTRLYVVMELMAGGQVQTADEFDPTRRAPLSEDECRNIMRQTLEALDYLHSKGMVHGDIKPENILCSEDRSVVKIIDFGNSELCGKGVDLWMLKSPGTVGYYAPECCGAVSMRRSSGSLENAAPGPAQPLSPTTAAARNADARAAGGDGIRYCGRKADIWALGITLHTLLMGSHPFSSAGDPSGSNCPRLFRNITRGVTIPKNWKDTECRRFLEWMTNLDPDDRPTARMALNHAWLRQACKQRPAAPVPVPVPERSPTRKILDIDQLWAEEWEHGTPLFGSPAPSWAGRSWASSSVASDPGWEEEPEFWGDQAPIPIPSRATGEDWRAQGHVATEARDTGRPVAMEVEGFKGVSFTSRRR